MKECPNCKTEVEDSFDLCWNCRYSFSDQKVLENEDYVLVCPKCSAVIDTSLHYCPNCRYDLTELSNQTGIKLPSPKHLDCLRCKVPLDYLGNFEFHEGARYGALGNLFELLTNKESFDLYSCPNCGKVEFFLPGFDGLIKEKAN